MDSFPLILEKRYASVQFPQIRQYGVIPSHESPYLDLIAFWNILEDNCSRY